MIDTAMTAIIPNGKSKQKSGGTLRLEAFPFACKAVRKNGRYIHWRHPLPPGGFPEFPNRRARERGSGGRFSDLPNPRAGKLRQKLGQPASESRKPLHGATATRETCRKVAKSLHEGPATRETCQFGGDGYANSENLPARCGAATETRETRHLQMTKATAGVSLCHQRTARCVWRACEQTPAAELRCSPQGARRPLSLEGFPFARGGLGNGKPPSGRGRSKGYSVVWPAAGEGFRRRGFGCLAA